jgi:hypothetical protein
VRLLHHRVEIGADHLGADRPVNDARDFEDRRFEPLPSLASSDGFVVTPSTKPISATCLISSRFAESMKNFMALFPCAPPGLVRLFELPIAYPPGTATGQVNPSRHSHLTIYTSLRG